MPGLVIIGVLVLSLLVFTWPFYKDSLTCLIEFSRISSMSLLVLAEPLRFSDSQDGIAGANLSVRAPKKVAV